MPHDATPKQIYLKKINFSQFNTLLENDYRGATHTHTKFHTIEEDNAY